MNSCHSSNRTACDKYKGDGGLESDVFLCQRCLQRADKLKLPGECAEGSLTVRSVRRLARGIVGGAMIRL